MEDKNVENVDTGKGYFIKPLTGKESIKTGKIDMKRLLQKMLEKETETSAAKSVAE